MRKNLVPMGTLVFVLFFINKTNAQRLIPPNIPEGLTPRTIVPDRLKLPDVKGPFITVGSTRLTSQTSNASAEAGQPLFQSSGVSSEVSLWNIPFSFGYNSVNGWQNREPLNFGVSTFDKEKYLQQLAERLKKAANPEELFAGYLNSLYAKRDEVLQRIRKDLSAVIPSANEAWAKELMHKVNADNIAYLGMDGLLNKINETAALQSSSSGGQIATRLSSLRQSWLNEGVMETIGSFEKQKKALLDQLMKDPAAIAKAASQHLQLNGLRKLMTYATNVNLGSSGVSQGDLQLKNVLLDGVSAGFLKGNKYLAPVLGKQPGMKSIAESGYANFNQLPDIFTTALRMGKGDVQKDFSHVSISLFQQGNNMQLLQNGLMPDMPRNFVTTFSKRMTFGKSDYLLAEISKSTMLYSGASGEKGGGLRNMVNGNDLMANMGVTLDYGSEFEKIGLANRLTIRYTGKEYQNLGNAFLAGGAKEISNDLKKYFLDRRLVIHSRMSLRQYEFSVSGRKLRTVSYLADVKWKMKKGEFIEVRYQPYFNRSILQENNLQSRSHRLALRGNISRKIARGVSYRNFIEIASSKDDFYDVVFGSTGNANRVISFTSLQTITVGQRTMFVNITGNRANQNTGFLFGNSSLSVDAGSHFTAGKNIMLSTALVYNEVVDMYKQLALRQSVSAMLGRKLVVDGFVQTGPKLRELPGLNMPLTTGNLSISYNLK